MENEHAPADVKLQILMKINFSKFGFKRVSSPQKAILDALGSSPKKYWVWFIITAAVLFCAVLIFNFYFLSFLGIRRPPEPVETAEISGPAINLSGLEKTIEILKEKELDFKKILDNPLPGNPAL